MEQITESLMKKCIHFTGLANPCCAAGIYYETVRSKEKPFRFPCLKLDRMGGECPKQSFLTQEEAEKKATEVFQMGANTLGLIIRIRDLEKKEGKKSGSVDCPCGAQARFHIASSNGHIWAKCPGCGINVME